VEMARMNWQRAEAAAELARVSFQRVENLSKDGLVPAQKRDEAEANFKASRDAATAAKAQYDMARTGARAEDKAAASAQARQVSGVVAEVEAAKAETELRSPVAGEVAKVLAKVGELSPQGVALVSVVDLKDQWVVLNVREDRLQRFALGSEFDATLPALHENGVPRSVHFKVFYSAALPDFATWRATRSGQGFDARTFEVRARPMSPIADARPGMSVLVQ
jgi:HlyD family secretion protein